MDAVLAHLAAAERWTLADLRALVAIPSVSADPAHAGDVRRAAGWVAERLRAAGPIEVELVETARHPAVLGSWSGRPGAPTALVYGHLDVQPADPLAAWRTPPFELTERDGRLYGRGVSDDKASMLIPLWVAEAFFRAGDGPPLNLRFLFESEEEIGSPSLPALVRARREQLACDVVLSADGGMRSAERPSLTLGARGMAALELTVRGASKDLHSGRHGGAVANPLQAIAQLLASLHRDGRVAVEGFYEGVEEPTETELAALARVEFDDDAYRRELGVPALHGEPGHSTLARLWLRPTLEANGLWGGYQGRGSKTVIPHEAHAKLSCRLVAGQDPEAVLARLEAHLQRHCPPGVTLALHGRERGAPAYRIADDHPALAAAAATLAEVFGREPERVAMGGSVPIVACFKEVLGADTVFFSFSTADEDIHAPNEFYRLERLRLGLQGWARLWRRLPDALAPAPGGRP